MNSFSVTTASPALGPHTLFWVRKQFIQISLRFDLIKDGDVDANVDNGANFYINAAQKWLDFHASHTRQTEKVFGVWAEDEVKVLFDGLISISKVKLVDPDLEAFIEFTGDSNSDYQILSNEDFRKCNPSKFSEFDSSLPSECTLGVIGVTGAIATTTATDFDTLGIVNYDEVTFGNSYNKTAIVFNTKADKDYTVEVEARTLSRTLFYDYDYSFWTVSHLDILLQTACMMLEMFMKNTTGVQDYRNVIMEQLNELDNALVEQQFFLNKNSEILT